MNRMLVIALPALAIASLYAALRTPDAQPRRVVPAAGAQHDEPARAPLPALADTLPAGRDWALGQQRIHDFEMSLRVRTDDVAPDTSDDPLIHLRGDWTVTVVGLDDVVTLRAQLANARLTPADYIDGAADLRAPFQVRVSREGQLLEAAFAPQMSAAARQMLRQVAAAAQMTRPVQQPQWTVEEADATGRYIARYQMDGEAVRRTKPRYLTLVSADAPVAAPVGLQVDSQSRFTLDTSGHPATIETTERMRVPGDDVLPTLRTLSQTRFTLRSLSQSDAALAGTFVAESIAAPLGTDRRETERLDRDLLGDATVDSLLADLDAALDLDRSAARSARNHVMPRLAAQFRLAPETIRTALDAVADADESTLGTVVAAVGATGTNASRDALVGLLADDQPAAMRAHAVTAMNLMENADDSTVQALTALLDDDALQHAAALALGGNARHGDFAEADPVEILLAQYAQAQNDHARMVIIDALGNSGDERAWPTIRGALGVPALAESALFALRFLPVAEVDQLLGAVLLQSPAEMQKLNALKVIAYRDRAAWQGPLVAALEAEQSEKVQAAIRALL